MRLNEKMLLYQKYINDYSKVLGLSIGDSVKLSSIFDFSNVTRVRDKRGRFAKTNRSTYMWTKEYISRKGTDDIIDIFRSQIIGGHSRKGVFPEYKEATKKRKKKKVSIEFVNSFSIYPQIYGYSSGEGRYNLVWSGKAISELTNVEVIPMSSPFRILFNYNQSVYKEYGYFNGMDFGLTNQSINFFVSNFLLPFVKNLGGTITDLKVKRRTSGDIKASDLQSAVYE